MDIQNQTGLKVNEIYKSYQGEGKYQGQECVFLRLAYCDLQCTFCDTPYTWDWKNYDINKESHIMHDLHICDKICEFDIDHLVITGGEPLLQQIHLIQLLNHMKFMCANRIEKKIKHLFVEVETNGLHLPLLPLRSLVNQWNVSPKTNNSGNTHVNLKKIYNYQLPNWNNIADVIFKFVVKEPRDFDEINEYAKLIDNNKIWIMPEGKTKQEIENKANWLYKMCEYFSYNLTLRQHILEYGNKRGV